MGKHVLPGRVFIAEESAEEDGDYVRMVGRNGQICTHRTCVYSRRVCRGGWGLCQNSREEWVNMYSQDVCLQEKSLQRRMGIMSEW